MRFDVYEAPKDIRACAELLHSYGDGARILAGGTDVIPRLRSRAWKVKALIDVTGIPALNGIAQEADGISIGAAVRLSQLQNAVCRLPGAHGILSCAAGHVSSLQVRNAATLGGNLCNASPSADTVPAMVVLNAVARIAGGTGIRELPVENVPLSPGRNALKPGEVLTNIFLPEAPAHTGAAYYKYSIRGDSDIAILGAGASLTLDDDGVIKCARIALGAVGPTVYRAIDAEALLINRHFSGELAKEAAELVRKGCSPITDQRATAEYRREMAFVWTVHALEDAYRRAVKEN